MPNVTVSLYDVCLPCYFGGHHLPVLQIPVDGATTRKDLYNSLLSELNRGVIDYKIDENNLDHDTIREAIKDCIYWNGDCKDSDIVFPDLEIWTEEDYEELTDCCYAFFVISWEEEE